MKKTLVKLGKRSYPIIVGQNVIGKVPPLVKSLDLGDNAVIITNPIINKLFGKTLERLLNKNSINSATILVGDSEKSKSEKVAFKVLHKIASFDNKKGIFVIALGGGVVGDLSGFVSSIYKRGIPFLQIPTTFLAQVDSSIGGKTAIDLDVAKNLVGSFYQPKAVITDINFLKTLPRRQVLNGLGEVIKYGIIKDKDLFYFIENRFKEILKLDIKVLEYIVFTAASIKAKYVEKDEFDALGIRAELNLGHTIGHAVEAAIGFNNRYNHGEAVSFGIVIATEISKELGLIKEEDSSRIISLIKNMGLPTVVRGLSLDKIIKTTYYDKKIVKGVNRFILPTGIGKAKVVKDVPIALVKKVLRKRVI